MSSAPTIAAVRQRSREPLAALLVACSALAFGAVAAKAPFIAIGALGVGLVIALAFFAPVLHLVLLIVVTAIVPYGLQNRFGIGGGEGSPGLLVSDVLLMTGLVRAAVVLVRRPLDRRRTLHLGLVMAFLAAATAQFAHGVSEGEAISVAGAELRALLGFGVFIVALPIVSEPAGRARLAKSLPLVGVALGLWGLAQWILQIPFNVIGDAGVREGVELTTTGKGQIQGGLYAFPVAIILSVAALTLRRELPGGMRLVLGAVVILNGASLLLTYERTFWIATALGCGVVILKGRRGERARAVLVACLAFGALLVALATLAPSELTAARERLLSLGQYGQDDSVRYRLTESRVVLEEIREHPLTGSGLAAEIFWGRPWEGVRPQSRTYSHNGYLWLAWKLGLPIAVLLLIMVGLSFAYRDPPRGGPLWLALRGAAQAALIGLLLASVTFPSFNTPSITATMGLLLAMAAAPVVRGPPRAGASVSMPAWQAPPAPPLEPALRQR